MGKLVNVLLTFASAAAIVCLVVYRAHLCACRKVVGEMDSQA